MPIFVRRARVEEAIHVAGVLMEAAEWLQQRGTPMWRADELAQEGIAADVTAGDFYVVEVGRIVAGTLKFQLQDELFWPDVPPGESAFVHRLAVRRAFAGGRVSHALLSWAVERARAFRCRFLRLDCEASRPKLRQFYERFGFRHHSDRQVGPYFVARYEMELLAG